MYERVQLAEQTSVFWKPQFLLPRVEPNDRLEKESIYELYLQHPIKSNTQNTMASLHKYYTIVHYLDRVRKRLCT